MRKKVVENLKQISDSNDCTNIPGVWSVIRKVFPKVSNSMPSGKKDLSGKVVTNPTKLKQLYQKMFKERLRVRPTYPEMINVQMMQENILNLD